MDDLQAIIYKSAIRTLRVHFSKHCCERLLYWACNFKSNINLRLVEKVLPNLKESMPVGTSVDGNILPMPPAPYLEKYWLISESLLVILTLGAAYLVVCLLRHAVVKKATRRSQHFCQQIWLKWLCVFSSVTLLLRLCSDHVVAVYGWQNDESCLITVTVSTVLFMLSLYSIYTFLWVRQSVFYTDAIMKSIIPAWITYVSWCTLAFMIVSGAAMGVMYNLPQITQWNFTATAEGCKEVSVDSPEIIPGIGAACSILFQVILLALFVYPLLSREMAKFRAPQPGSNSAVNDKYQSSSFSHSGENKQPKDDNDDVFYDDSPAESVATRPPTSAPMSPLARNLGERKWIGSRVSAETDTGPESGADVSKTDADRRWAKNTTIKREIPPSPNARAERAPKRKSMVERLRSVHPGSIFYRRAKSNSLSSENASPAVSDSEGRFRRRGTIFIKALRSKEKKGRKLVAMMKRYALLMFVCVLTDIVAAAIQIIFVFPELVYLIIYDINLTINLICVVMTFSEWRIILAPCWPNDTKADHAISTTKLKRKPTPLRRRRTLDRVQELRKEGRRSRPGSRSVLSSGSGYESGDSHIYRQPNEAHALIKSKR